jgi:hypothetical protein
MISGTTLFEQILKHAENQERNACIKEMRKNSGVNEDNPPLFKTLRKSTTGSTRRDPAFDLTGRRNVRVPVVTKKQGRHICTKVKGEESVE